MLVLAIKMFLRFDLDVVCQFTYYNSPNVLKSENRRFSIFSRRGEPSLGVARERRVTNRFSKIDIKLSQIRYNNAFFRRCRPSHIGTFLRRFPLSRPSFIFPRVSYSYTLKKPTIQKRLSHFIHFRMSRIYADDNIRSEASTHIQLIELNIVLRHVQFFISPFFNRPSIIKLLFFSLSTTMRCARHRVCWANTKHSGRPPEVGRDHGTISAGKTMPTKYKYLKCKYMYIRRCAFFQ